jgi:hypothetical protein
MMKTSELQGAALDWAVAKCEGRDIEFDDPSDPWLTLDGIAYQPLHSYTPSTDWAQGGPIIEREGIEVKKGNPLYFPQGNEKGDYYEDLWLAGKMHGPTPLIAAMRCYVASKLGEELVGVHGGNIWAR